MGEQSQEEFSPRMPQYTELGMDFIVDALGDEGQGWGSDGRWGSVGTKQIEANGHREL